MKTKNPWEFEKVGLGYRLWAEDAGVELNVGRLKRSGQELHGELRVTTNWEGVKTVDGTLHQARFNLSSATTRSSLGKILKGRTEGADAFKDMDWGDALEHLCQYVAKAERTGEPVVSMNGTMPKDRTKFDIAPICPHGVTSMLYGPGGIGKSAVALALALSVAKGMEIVPGFAPAVKGPALYLDWETDPYVVRERVEYISKGHQFKPTADLYYRRCARPLVDDAEELAGLIDRKGIKFVVVDSAGPAMGTSGEYGDANEGAIKLFNAMRHIGATTLLVDHVSKQEMKNTKGEITGSLPYGSIYKVNMARACWELVNNTTDDDDDIQVRVINTKANDSRLSMPVELSITWESAQGVIAFNDGPAFEAQPEMFTAATSGKTLIEAAVETLFNAHGGLSTKQLADALGKTTLDIRSLLQKHPNKLQRDLTAKGRDKPIKLVRSDAL
jgi:hypothetical protein